MGDGWAEEWRQWEEEFREALLLRFILMEPFETPMGSLQDTLPGKLKAEALIIGL